MLLELYKSMYSSYAEFRKSELHVNLMNHSYLSCIKFKSETNCTIKSHLSRFHRGSTDRKLVKETLQTSYSSSLFFHLCVFASIIAVATTMEAQRS